MIWIKLDLPNETFYIDISKLTSIKLLSLKGQLILNFINQTEPLIIYNNANKVLNQILDKIDKCCSKIDSDYINLCNIKDVSYYDD